MGVAQWAAHYGMYLLDGKTPMQTHEVPLYRALQGEVISNVEMILRPDGEESKIVLVSGHRLEDSRQCYGAMIAMRDITEKKLIEIRLRQTHKLEAVGQLAAGLAHEINNPTQFITDNVRFIRDALAAYKDIVAAAREMIGSTQRTELIAALRALEEARDLAYIENNFPGALEQTTEGLAHITSIVSAMKEFARPEPGGWELADLNLVLENVLTVANNEYKNIADLKCEWGSLPLLSCCLSELNQVFLNLVINAAHAIGEVVGESGDRGRITIRTELEESWVRIEVEDTGCGIPDEIKHRVFDPFFTTKEVGKGTGQGLAIAWAVVVHKHLGSISFQSEVGVGTTFIVRLPRPLDD